VRIHGFLIVRDEADLVAQGIEHLLTWCDLLHVLDNASQDGTWQIVQELALREPRLRPIASIDAPFHIGVRTLILDAVRDQLETGDWISRLDIDEWYHEDPRSFLLERVAPHEHRVCIHHHNFVWTRTRAAFLATLPDGGAALARDVVAAHDTYYTELPCIIEPRLFRYRRGMRWDMLQPVPSCSGPSARHRLPVRHYRWRSIPQAQARCALRARVASITQHGTHWNVNDWHQFVWDDTDPRLRIWRPGMSLSDPDYADHLGGWSKRLPARVAYALHLPQMLDRMRPLPAPLVPRTTHSFAHAPRALNQP
jgi:hypothetical protein